MINKEKLIYEIKSFLFTFVSVLVLTEQAILYRVIEGDFSKSALYALYGACVRTIIKTLWNMTLAWYKKYKETKV